MGQDKENRKKLLEFVQYLYESSGDKEFVAGIQNIVLKDIKNNDRELWTKQISDIYELCLKKNLREQAEDLYKDFQISEIAQKLVYYYIEMENARRANNFDSFGRYLFLQIELIVDTIIKDDEFKRIYEGIRDLGPLIRRDIDGNTFRTYRFEGRETIDKSLIIKNENYGKEINKLPTLDRCMIVMYTICYKASVSTWPKEEFNTLKAIYNIRNHESHTGGTASELQQDYYYKIVENKTKNYLHFLSFLLSFINGISSNYPYSNDLYILAGIKKGDIS